jgi:hypothetical protein
MHRVGCPSASLTEHGPAAAARLAARRRRRQVVGALLTRGLAAETVTAAMTKA